MRHPAASLPSCSAHKDGHSLPEGCVSVFRTQPACHPCFQTTADGHRAIPDGVCAVLPAGLLSAAQDGGIPAHVPSS